MSVLRGVTGDGDASRYGRLTGASDRTPQGCRFSLVRPRATLLVVPPRLKAWLLLTLAMIKSWVRRLSGRQAGIAAFRRAYDADGLPPVTETERAEAPTFSRCIACGICDRGESERIAASGGAYRGVMSLMLCASRSMPDFRAAAYSLSFVSDEALAEKERSCPADVPMRRIARFLRAKAAEVGGPWPLPPRIPSLLPKSE